MQCKCDNCNFMGGINQLRPARDLDGRLQYPLGDPRCNVPAGECPECGALAYAVDSRESYRKVVIVPSNEGGDADLLFLVPETWSKDRINGSVGKAVALANDDNGARSNEVIEVLEKDGFYFLGNPDTPLVVLTKPWI